MRKISYCVYGLIALIFGDTDVFAQAKWWPKSIDIEIPIEVTHQVFNDTITYQRSVFSFGGSLYSPKNIQKYIKNGEEVTVSYGPDTTFLPASITFTVDAASKTLRNFYLQYSLIHETLKNYYDEIYFGYEDHVSFSALNYRIIDDSVLVISESGAQCKKDLTAAETYHADYDFYNAPRARSYSGIEDKGSPVPEDTAAYSCSLTFVYSRQLNGVQESRNNDHGLNISTSLPDHTIHFTFSSSAHAQTMSIYDILGREVSRIEIPAGSSSYVLSSVSHAKGTFFARLCMQSASFMMN